MCPQSLASLKASTFVMNRNLHLISRLVALFVFFLFFFDVPRHYLFYLKSDYKEVSSLLELSRLHKAGNRSTKEIYSLLVDKSKREISWKWNYLLTDKEKSGGVSADFRVFQKECIPARYFERSARIKNSIFLIFSILLLAFALLPRSVLRRILKRN